jgi:hypothetical protein
VAMKSLNVAMKSLNVAMKSLNVAMKSLIVRALQFLFDHEAFSLSPLEGVVWPGASLEVMVTFHPNGPLNYEVYTFCEIFGKVDRVPLLLRGPGLGPKAVFSFDILDIGDTFINSVHQYKVRSTSAST